MVAPLFECNATESSHDGATAQSTHRMQQTNKHKIQPEHLKMCTFNLFPQGWVGLCRSEWGMKAEHHINPWHNFIIYHLKYHQVQSFTQYNTPAQTRKYWLYTNKISHFINLGSLSQQQSKDWYYSDCKCLSHFSFLSICSRLHNRGTTKYPIAIHFGVGGWSFNGAGLEKRSHILFILLCDDQELIGETASFFFCCHKWGQGLSARIKYTHLTHWRDTSSENTSQPNHTLHFWYLLFIKNHNHFPSIIVLKTI